ncbi:DUF1549 domain-containing protein [Tundrisphaera lichenicola]|uniref:DUF1549 domain-containing protein n=1 Tax=Tundrisphaera lichenicola TaxID=2029860 RepID=UPI003EBD29FC
MMKRTRMIWLAVAMLGVSHRTEAAERVTFERDIQPILTRAGCNAGACHGKARGQNGFQLSLLGFDPNADHAAIASEARGRRVFPAAPERSLLLQKAAALVPHGGGRKVEVGSDFYQTLLGWIADGMPRTPAEAPKLVKVAIEPTERTVKAGEAFPLKVTASYSDGSIQDVTHLAAFQSSEPTLVTAHPEGKAEAGPIPGEATVSARFQGNFANCHVLIPLPGDVPADAYDSFPRKNFIDDHVAAKLKKLGITPSKTTNDATFHRRAFIDAIGRLPTPDETRAFLADADPLKRDKLVDRLLDRPEYPDHWANKWADLLRPNPYRVGIKAVMNLDAWIRDAFRRNMPYDQFVREIVTARGSNYQVGPAIIWRDRREPAEATTIVTQIFLGIRLECAKCHHHPFESWGQEQFYEFAAYFARVGHKGAAIAPPIAAGEETVFLAKSGSVKHPLTGEVLPPKPLFGSAPVPDDPEFDPREALATWMTAPSNPYFSKVIVNRTWAELMGRGIVEPVDDLRATNPPSNGPLLDALAEDFVAHGYDLKHLIRTILTSATYGLSSEPTERNVADIRNFSRHYRQRPRAEVLLDAISDITGVPESYDAAPPGTRAAAQWTTRNTSLFMDTFGRPDPNQDPPCERTPDTSVVQALHLMNAPGVNQKIGSDQGLAARLAASDVPPGQVVEELYLSVYNRLPDGEERDYGAALFEAPSGRRRATEDLLWALINSPEFVFKD